MNEQYDLQVTQRLAIQLAVGKTAKGRISHRTVSVTYLRQDVTQEEVLTLVTYLAPLLEYPVSAANLVTKSVQPIIAAPKEERRASARQSDAAAAQDGPPRTFDLNDIAAYLQEAQPGDAPAVAQSAAAPEALQPVSPAAQKPQKPGIFANVRMRGFLPSSKPNGSKKKK